MDSVRCRRHVFDHWDLFCKVTFPPTFSSRRGRHDNLHLNALLKSLLNDWYNFHYLFHRRRNKNTSDLLLRKTTADILKLRNTVRIDHGVRASQIRSLYLLLYQRLQVQATCLHSLEHPSNTKKTVETEKHIPTRAQVRASHIRSL